MYIYTYMYVPIHINTYIGAPRPLGVVTPLHIYICIYVIHMYVCIYLHVFTHVYIYIYVYEYVYIM